MEYLNFQSYMKSLIIKFCGWKKKPKEISNKQMY